MRLTLGLLAATVTIAAPAAAQVRVHVGVGPVASSTLVRDSILEPIRVRPAVALAFSAGLEGVIDSVWHVGASLAWAGSDLESHTDTVAFIVHLAVWQPTVTASRVFGPFEAGVRAALQIYAAERAVGIFQDGGTMVPAVGATAAWRGLALGSLRLGLAGEWMVSRFTTTTLERNGFRGHQTVHRATLRVQVAGGAGAR